MVSQLHQKYGHPSGIKHSKNDQELVEELSCSSRPLLSSTEQNTKNGKEMVMR